MVKIVNPDTGVDIFAHVYGERLESVTVIDAPDWAPKMPGRVFVEVRPSLRPGLEADIAVYSEAWIVS